MKIDRLFAITNILIDRKIVTAAELADEFDVSVRTIYRDMDILSSCGIPIFTQKGKHGGISIMEHYTLSKTLLTDEEQKQIIMALQSMEVTGQIEVKEPLLKLRNVFQKNVESWVEIDFSSWEHSENEKKVFSMIKNSILYTTPLSFSYFNGKGEKSDRVVEPLKVVFKGHSWYLYGYCRNKKDFRFFKLSRIEDLQLSSGTFQVKKSEIVPAQYEAEQGKNVTLKLKIDRSMGFRVYDEFRNGIITEEKDCFLVEACLPISQWVYSYLLGYGDSLTVLEPPEIRQEYIKRLRKIEKNYNMT